MLLLLCLLFLDCNLLIVLLIFVLGFVVILNCLDWFCLFGYVASVCLLGLVLFVYLRYLRVVVDCLSIVYLDLLGGFEVFGFGLLTLT